MARVKTGKLKTRRWDVTEHLDSEERTAKYLEAAFADGDPALIAAAIGDVARARGMSQLADEIDVSRPALYRALSAEGNPEFATVAKVLRAFGLKLAAMPLEKVKRRKAA
jgi:probable addiction module antidote protein